MEPIFHCRRRQAAARFGGSVSSAIRWVRSWYAYGNVRAKRQGGDRRSWRIEAHAGFLLEQIEQTPDVTLAELQGMLREPGVSNHLTTDTTGSGGGDQQAL